MQYFRARTQPLATLSSLAIYCLDAQHPSPPNCAVPVTIMCRCMLGSIVPQVRHYCRVLCYAACYAWQLDTIVQCCSPSHDMLLCNCVMLFSSRCYAECDAILRAVRCWARAAHRSGGSARHVVEKHARAPCTWTPPLHQTCLAATLYSTASCVRCHGPMYVLEPSLADSPGTPFSMYWNHCAMVPVQMCSVHMQ